MLKDRIIMLILLQIIFFFTVSCDPGNIKKAEELIELGKTGEALEILNKEIMINPKNPVAYFALGNAFYCRNELTQAIENYEIAIKLNSKEPIFQYVLGVLCSNYDLRRAIVELDKTCEIQPQHLGAHTYLAYIYEDIGEIDKSKEHMNISMRLKQIGKKWTKIQEQENTTLSIEEAELEEMEYGGTFIVRVPEAPIFSAEDGKELKKLEQFNVRAYLEKGEGKYFF